MYWYVSICSEEFFWPQYIYHKKSPNNGYRLCPLGKLSHLGLEQFLCPIIFHYFVLITRSYSVSESLHFFNTHSHIHKFLVLIAGTTLLHFFIFTVNSLSLLLNTKVRYILPPIRHIVCRLCILIHLPQFWPIHHDINTSFVCINTHFIYFHSYFFSFAINKHKCEYYWNI